MSLGRPDRVLAVGADLVPTGPGGRYDAGAAAEIVAMAGAGLGLVRLYVSWAASSPKWAAMTRKRSRRSRRPWARRGAWGCRCGVSLFADMGGGIPGHDRGRQTGHPDRPVHAERAASLTRAVAGALSGKHGLVAWQVADEGFLAGSRDDTLS